MTKIKQITAKGFKSFAKKTVIDFGDQFNCVLGPNGSGKSNICDAICFVLGKSSAKSLRAEKSANLIYNGGKKKTPAKEAEVSIVFDNSKKSFPLEISEITISRTVKQNGNSTYRINNEIKSRQQVVDLLSAATVDPDSHSIVLQGDIVHFMNMRTNERREVIEEISGISIFEEKKDQAMKELDKVQEKLNEANIILTEREKTLKDLKKDRDQALKYKDVETNLQRNKATRVHQLVKDKQEKYREVDNKVIEFDKSIEALKQKVTELKKDIETKQRDVRDIEKEIDEKGDKKQKEITNEIDELKINLVKDTTRKEVCENEVKKISERKKQLENNLIEVKNTINNLENKKQNLLKQNSDLKKKDEDLKQKLEAFKKKHGVKDLEGYSKKIEDIDSKIENGQKDLHESIENKQLLLREQDKFKFEVEQLEKEIEKAFNLKEGDKEKIVQLRKNKEKFKEVTQQLSKSLNDSAVASSQLSSARSRFIDLNDEIAKLRARNIGIKESMAGDIALSRLKSMKIPGIYGTVADLGKVNSKYSLALEVAAGARIKSLVVNNDAVAAKCIQILKQNKLGIATFLPLNKLKERFISSSAKDIAKDSGVHGLALDLVSYDPQFKTVFNFVFGSTVIVDDLQTARKIGIGKERMVTIEGDIVETSGAMVGGYRSRRVGMSFQEKEVDKNQNKLENEAEKLRSQISILETDKFNAEESVIKLREEKAILEAGIRANENLLNSSDNIKELKNNKNKFESEVKEIEKRIVSANNSIKEIEKGIAQLKTDKEQFKAVLNKFQNSDVTTGFNRIEKEGQLIREEIIKHNAEVQGIDNQIGMYVSEIEKVNDILKNHEKEKSTFETEFEELKQSLIQTRTDLKQKQGLQKQFYSDYQHMFTKKMKIEKAIQDNELVIIKNDERVIGVEERRNDFVVKKAILGGEIEGLKKEAEEYVGIQLRRGIALDILNSEIREFETMLRNMGNVNLRALEIYEKVHEEYQILLEKYDKLKSEKEDVLELMFEIESKKKDIFMKTFKDLAKHFKEIFASLSSKGEAHLLLENEEDPFQGGVDIQVKLTGTKALDIKSLSGGEKTMAALAFIFAVQEFSPAPFYLLDEVDAALDKQNSALLSRLIAKYSDHAQYIVISHNDAIISEAHTIYGVSMVEGQSKVLSLKI
ncbi:MAG: chromosome segregation protein SMC [archaeon]